MKTILLNIILLSFISAGFVSNNQCSWCITDALWLDIIANGLIALAYFIIPIIGYYFIKRRIDFKFTSIFFLFSFFLLFSGLAHLFTIYSVFDETLGLLTPLRVITAILSCLSIFFLLKTLPDAMRTPSIESLKKESERSNRRKIEQINTENQRQQESLLRESTNSSHVGIFVIELSGKIKMANDAALNIFDYAKDDLENKNIAILMPLEHLQEYTSLILEFFHSQRDEIFLAKDDHVSGLTRSGKTIPLEVRLTKRKNANPPIMFVSCHDLSYRFKVEKSLRDNESMLSSIFNSLPIGLHTFDVVENQLVLVGYNNAAQDILKRSHSPLVGKPLHDCFPSLIETGISKIYFDIAVNGGHWIDEKLAYSDSNLQGIYSVQCFQSKPGTAVVLFEDVSQKHANKVAIEQKDRFINSAFNASITAVYIYDLQTSKIDYVNDTFTHLTGYSLAEMKALNEYDFINLFHNDDQLALNEHFNRIANEMTTNERFQIEYRIKHKAGHWLWCFGQDVVLDTDAHGKVTRFMGSFLDISELKEMQHNLQDLKEKADIANNAKSTFLANMSHEVRTPLNAILGLTNLVLKMELGEKQRKYLSKVESSSTLLLNVLNDVLDYSKMEAGKLEVKKESFAIRQVINASVDLYSLIANEKNIDMRVNIDAAINQYYMGDALRLNQILNNLIGNAVKFTSQGYVEISVYSLWTNGNESIQLDISDTGIGIEESKITHLFDSFNQADTSILRRYGGSGLGLSISLALANLMDGTIKVTSKPNVGSTFSLTLPMARSEKQNHDDIDADSMQNLLIEPTVNKPEALDINLNNVFNGSHALLVEDNETNQLVAIELLTILGVKVTPVNNGEQAIIAYNNDNFDIILMDLHMPVIDGYSASKTIRRLNREPSVPIIAMSAAVMTSDLAKVKASGMNGHVPKPIDINTLYGELSKWLTSNDNFGPTLSLPDTLVNGQQGIAYLQSLDSFDVTAALTRMYNNHALYSKLLHSFYQEHQHSIKSLNKAVADKNVDALYGIVHNIKGVSGSIGAVHLHTLSTHLESLINAKHSMPSPADVNEFIAHLAIVLTDIKQALISSLLSYPSVSVQNDLPLSLTDRQISAQITAISATLASGSFLTSEEITQQFPILQRILSADDYHKFILYIELLDYENANKHLETCAKQ